jgi:hypothetical protein
VILGAAATLRIDSMADDDMARRLLGATESSAA